MNALKELRVKHKLSIEDVALSVGVDPLHLIACEDGTAEISQALVSKLAFFFETTTDLIRGEVFALGKMRLKWISQHCKAGVSWVASKVGQEALTSMYQATSCWGSHKDVIAKSVKSRCFELFLAYDAVENVCTRFQHDFSRGDQEAFRRVIESGELSGRALSEISVTVSSFRLGVSMNWAWELYFKNKAARLRNTPINEGHLMADVRHERLRLLTEGQHESLLSNASYRVAIPTSCDSLGA
ncbi:helix-turn-helix transcriptional regulator [Thalassospira xiamenensis]|uniref:DNA-binding transcriptional regulator, XRE-family HTH domain n=1 Tax=Thalassospira xiamenensis TaxID=220697 RepID=A0A285TY73_9PROT|nr:helix-turn-helix transcriptional regulator [Thalassospira xiamenensis]SOC30933.1 DNA-binding transcriptional regulator, XRE-family HTH domain [Thalassospira xiamenensis]